LYVVVVLEGVVVEVVVGFVMGEGRVVEVQQVGPSAGDLVYYSRRQRAD
jgi:hypothetical protein